MSKTTKSPQEGKLSKPLAVQIADARSALNNALIRGDRTDQLRAFLNELEAKKRDEDAAVSREQAAAAVRAAEEQSRIASGAQHLADARAARIAALVRPIPPRPVTLHA
ncbi:hypothetical protein [Paraburkholderia strydomiana]|uniref:hypothetical protein n=1 Tax=Paraburkholderia strydomiana TaxID=1245417 RepID=UPI0038BC0526